MLATVGNSSLPNSMEERGGRYLNNEFIITITVTICWKCWLLVLRRWPVRVSTAITTRWGQTTVLQWESDGSFDIVIRRRGYIWGKKHCQQLVKMAASLKLNTMADKNLLKLKGRTIYFSYRGEITNLQYHCLIKHEADEKLISKSVWIVIQFLLISTMGNVLRRVWRKCMLIKFINPLSPKSDQHQISPCNINAL